MSNPRTAMAASMSRTRWAMRDGRGDASPAVGSLPEGSNRRSPVSSFAARSPRIAAIAFCLYLIVIGALLLFVFGRDQFATMDDWMLIGTRDVGSVSDLLRDHNQHLSIVTVLIYKGIFSLVGFSTYLPYQFVAVVIHLGVAAMLRSIMRGIGVGPWSSTLVAGAFALINGGVLPVSQFQMTSALLLALAQFHLMMRPQPSWRRQVAAILLGLFAIGSSGIAIPVVVATGFVTWRRSGWRMAAVQTVPLAVVYMLWWMAFRPTAEVEGGAQLSLAGLARWVLQGEAAVYVGLAGFAIAAVLLAVAVAVGLSLALVRRPVPGVRLMEPTALAAGSALLLGLAYVGRGAVFADGSTHPRFLYLNAALCIPLIGCATSALLSYRRWLGLAVAIPLMCGLIMNLVGWKQFYLQKGQWNLGIESVVAAILTSQAGESTPDWVRPWPGFFGMGDTTWGFLRRAQRNGQLDLDTERVGPKQAQAALIRLRLAQLDTGVAANLTCGWQEQPLVVKAPSGTTFGYVGALDVRIAGAPSPQGVATFTSRSDGATLEVVGPDPSTGAPLTFEFSSAEAGVPFYFCR